MTYVMIEPKKINSIRSAMKIVNLLRANKFVASQSIISVVINGFDEHHIIVSTDEAYNEVCAILNSNQDLYNYYNGDWPSPTY